MSKFEVKGIEELIGAVQKEEAQKPILSFEEFVDISSNEPQIVFRNIFQHFYDMTHFFLLDRTDVSKYKDAPNSLEEFDSLLAKDLDNPFFSDRFFSKRLFKLISSLRGGVQQNKIYVFEGPPGCGKSVFLNNLLDQFELYSQMPHGAMYETIWNLDLKKLDPSQDFDSNELLVPCPNHDHPITQIPKNYRKDFLESILNDSKIKDDILSKKEYEWVFENDPCTVCSSLSDVIMEKTDFGSLLEMLNVRKYGFKRNVGEGISIFNPSDKVVKEDVMTNKYIQTSLENLFKDSNRVPFLYSHFAKTNNGIYAVMDVKEHNIERFRGLHGIVSDRIHKVKNIEESVQSLFFVVINPEDRNSFKDIKSFKDRINTIPCRYVLDYKTEIEIYKEKFGDVDENFLPHVLDFFSKLIISSRIEPDSGLIDSNLEDQSSYHYDHCDDQFYNLKMELYANNIPSWITDDDKKNLQKAKPLLRETIFIHDVIDEFKDIRELLYEESEILCEGESGISGRKSIALFQKFLQQKSSKNKLIDIIDVASFFVEEDDNIDLDLMTQMVKIYDCKVINEIKTSLYHYDKEHITRDIENYLFAVNQKENEKVRCVYTGDEFVTSEDFFERIEKRLLGKSWKENLGKRYREEIVKKELLAELIDIVHGFGADIKDTKIFQRVFKTYADNLKENVLDPFLGNDNFGYAIKVYGKEDFNTFDEGIQRDVEFLLNNLENTFGYSKQGAKQIATYAVDFLMKD